MFKSKPIINLFLTFSILFVSNNLLACTGIIFTGKATKDGRPLMLKQRDSKDRNVAIESYTGSKYKYISHINTDFKFEHSLCGANEAGLAIMNSASYNLGKRVFDENHISPSNIMVKALGTCKNIEEFDELLQKFTKPFVPTNIGVIDAFGGAAYYEIAPDRWKKYDINDSAIAPKGYFVFSNYSLIGDLNNKYGIERKETAELVLSKVNPINEIDAQWVFNNICRLNKEGTLSKDLLQGKPNGQNSYPENFFIANEQTTSAVIFQGLLPNESPLNVIMWTLLGYPPTGVVVPLPVNQPIPSFMKRDKNIGNSKISQYASVIKKKLYGNNSTNNQGNIISQLKTLNITESEMFVKISEWNVFGRKSDIDSNKLNSFYESYYNTIHTLLTSNSISFEL